MTSESIVAAARAFTALPPKRRDRGLHFPSRHRRACLILSIMVVRVNGIRFNTGYKFTHSVLPQLFCRAWQLIPENLQVSLAKAGCFAAVILPL